MGRVAQLEARSTQVQLVGLGAKLHRGAAQHLVVRCIGGRLEFDFHPVSQQGRTDQVRQLGQPSRQQRIDDKTVIGVVGADGVEAQPGTAAVFVKA
ncbi:hypothetical protein D3C80_1780590 [compost metagenome]